MDGGMKRVVFAEKKKAKFKIEEVRVKNCVIHGFLIFNCKQAHIGPKRRRYNEISFTKENIKCLSSIHFNS